MGVNEKLRNNYSNFILYKKALSNPLNLFRLGLRFIGARYFGIKVHPSNISFAVTDKCNYNCWMCYDGDFKNQNSREKTELSLEEIKRFIRSIAKSKPLLIITGGEPFLRKDILEILHSIRKNRVPCSIVTNGSLLTDRIINEIPKLKLESIIVSMHGVEGDYDKATLTKAKFSKVVENLRKLCRVKAKTHIMVNCAILPQNHKNLNKLVSLAEKAGADSVRFEHVNFITSAESKQNSRLFEKVFPGKNLNLKLHKFVTDEDLSNLASTAKQLKKLEHNHNIPIIFKPYLSDNEIARWYSSGFATKRRCIMPWLSVFVRSDGEVSPCPNFDFSLGNIKKNSLFRIFNTSTYHRFRQRMKKGLFPGCLRCCKL